MSGKSIADRWNGFWFKDGGRLSLAMARMGVATAVLLSLRKLHTPDFAAALSKLPLELYAPVGILRLLGSSPPSASLLAAIQMVAWLSALAMLIGLASRLSTIVSLLTALALASFQSSFSPGWHHVYPLVFLAQIPLIFAPVGDALSVDDLLRRWRGRARRVRAVGQYVWGIRLVQFAVALVFFNAFEHKLIQGGFSLDWALSDNLRHHLLMRYDWVGLERSPTANWLLQSQYRYKAAALLNLAAQSLPFVACFIWRRSWLRFALGSLIVVETLALGFVMHMWNLHWLPVAVVFVDWDRLAAWVRRRWLVTKNTTEDAPTAASPTAASPTAVSPGATRGISAWIGLYLATWLLLGFMHPPLDQKANLFPFSRFPMFSGIRASKPYSTHQSYEVLGTRLAIECTPPLSSAVQARLDRNYGYRWLHRITDPKVLEKRLASIARDLKRRYKVDQVQSVTLWLTVFQAPAYPAKAELVEHRIAISGQWRADTPFVSYLRKAAASATDHGTLGPGPKLPDGTEFFYHPNDATDSIPVTLESQGDAPCIEVSPGTPRSLSQR